MVSLKLIRTEEASITYRFNKNNCSFIYYYKFAIIQIDVNCDMIRSLDIIITADVSMYSVKN
jgi:hypothetical protein